MRLGIPKKRGSAAYTLIEILVAIGIFGFFASSLTWTLSAMNYYAVLGRLYSGAMEAVQQQIDLVLTDGAFSYNSSQFPSELPSVASGSSTTVATSNVTIYQDNSSATTTVNGTMTTKLENTGTTYNQISGDSTNLNIYRITVTLTFTYRGKNYAVTSATMRAPDTN